MKDGKTNQHPGKCARCGGPVAAGEGVLERREANGGYAWAVEHVTCPEEGAAPSGEAPRWAVYDVEGFTPRGNRAVGMALVDGAKPEGGVPANDVARAVDGKAGR